MGRYLEGGEVNQLGSLAISGTLPTKVVGAGYMGEFGSGAWRFFGEPGNYNWTVPAGVSKIRVRVLGGGGGAGTNAAGGGGGGYAHGVFDVTPGATYSIVVGARGSGGADGGTSSFGALISATGGKGSPAGSTVSAAGGVGVGGDFRASGGASGAVAGSGGGGAGSQLGDGGASAAKLGSGGGGVSGNPSIGSGGASAFGSIPSQAGVSGDAGPDIRGRDTPNSANGFVNEVNAVIRFPFDGFTGSGGSGTNSGSAFHGGPGAGGGGNNLNGGGGNGGIGGGGGGCKTGNGGAGGYGGGSGGTADATYGGLQGGRGLVIVEF